MFKVFLSNCFRMVVGAKFEIKTLKGSLQVTVFRLMLSMKLVKHGIDAELVQVLILALMEHAFQMTSNMKSVSTQLLNVSTVNSTLKNVR